MPSDEQTYPFSVSFDYSGHDSFGDLASAMQTFSDAFAAYARNRKAELKIINFSPGSLNCSLAANQDAWMSVQVMAQDFSDIQNGRRSVLMPEAARNCFRRMLNHVAAVNLKLDDQVFVLNLVSSSLLDLNAKDDSRRTTVHTGILDRVDLKANIFRIMLPHGQRITCTPALTHIEPISECLANHVPRLKVIGSGRYRGSDFLPASIKVSDVEVIGPSPRFSDLVSEVTRLTDSREFTLAWENYQNQLESRLVEFDNGRD